MLTSETLLYLLLAVHDSQVVVAAAVCVFVRVQHHVLVADLQADGHVGTLLSLHVDAPPVNIRDK